MTRASSTSRLLVCAATLVLVVPFISAHAQTGKLTGIVTDAATNQPIEGVQVILQGTGYGGLTQSNGRFFIIALPPGTYTVSARRIGYQTTQQQTQILIDVTRTINFSLNPSTAQLQAVRVVESGGAPLVELSQTGTTQSITAEELEGLPVRSIRDAITLQAGFQEIPLASTDLTSFAASRRVGTPSVLIRGGRSGETMTLIDGIPVSNFLFGGGALDVTDKATAQIQTIKGGLEPQYGNALSGVVNIATREGGENLAGSIEYETSRFGGAMGSIRDELRNYDFVDGFLSGPVPATAKKLRFVVAGRTSTSAGQVMEYDQDINDPFLADTTARDPHDFDLIPGWMAQGYTAQRDLFGKLTYYFNPTTTLSVNGIDVFRETMNIPFDWRLTGYSFADACVQQYQDRYGRYINVRDACDTEFGADATRSNGRVTGSERYAYVTPAPIGSHRSLYTARFGQTIRRFNYTIVGGVFDQRRLTCATYFSGVCIGERIADTNFSGRFVTPGVTSPEITPTEGTDQIAGNDRMTTRVLRFDAQIQATDHHNLATGLFYQGHDIVFREIRDVGLNNIVLQPSDYAAKPWDAAVYLQDRIEYDFLTIKLGARFDYGKAKGTFFNDPLDPTNGTTIRDVCNNPTAWGLPAGFSTFVDDTVTFTGLAGCLHPDNDSVGAEAVRIAARDDMGEAAVRQAFSPRLSLGFPISERSQAFFNFGIYYQNPLYNNLYQSTGIGTDAEGTPAGPALAAGNFIGNPHLEAEKTVSYEVGYVAEFARNFSMLLVAFSKDQSGLTGIRQGGIVRSTLASVNDPGNTYGTAAPSYTILMNVDYQTVRGFEMEFRRRLANYWSARINYSYSQATNNAPPPDLQFQQTEEEGDIPARSEIRSSIDQRHSLGGVLSFVVREQVPGIRFGSVLRNTSLKSTLRIASGLPYTPTITFGGGGTGRLERNSGTSPTTFRVDLQANKDFSVTNMRYGMFVRIDNVFDRLNCAQVFTTTGNCSRGTTAQARLAAGNFTGESESSTFFDRPQYVSTRRTINAGVKVTF